MPLKPSGRACARRGESQVVLVLQVDRCVARGAAVRRRRLRRASSLRPGDGRAQVAHRLLHTVLSSVPQAFDQCRQGSDEDHHQPSGEGHVLSSLRFVIDFSFSRKAHVHVGSLCLRQYACYILLFIVMYWRLERAESLLLSKQRMVRLVLVLSRVFCSDNLTLVFPF